MDNLPLLPPLLPLFFFVFVSTLHVSSLPPTQFVYRVCNVGSFSNGSTFSHNFQLAFSTLSNLSSSSLFDTYTTPSASFNNSNDQIFAAYQCRGDLSLTDCSLCISQLQQDIRHDTCANNIGLTYELDGCFLRYENYSFFHLDTSWWFQSCSEQNVSDSAFQKNKESALDSVIRMAPEHGGYLALSIGQDITSRVYSMAQCLGFLSNSDCAQCLSMAVSLITCRREANGARLHLRSCFVRYANYLFYTPSTAISLSPSPLPSSVNPGRHSRKNTLIIIASVTAGILLCALTICIILLNMYRRSKHKRLRNDMEGMNHAISTGVFTLADLTKATNEFHPDNKLGEGGFGPVYKGILRDGREVAIKKLSNASNQGLSSFINEIDLIGRVQHRNLIRLYGCCIEGSARLLVYEYLPHNSVEKMLFVDGTAVDWYTRVEIIRGTARGLAYLHEDSPTPIIHRDIKLSNILLDEHMNAKIADFGMARLFPKSDTHATTRLAGTFGYLAPEYAMHGMLTKKADVFSFGVVTLEIVSGRRNNDAHMATHQQSLLEWAWILFKEGRQVQMLDPNLNGMFLYEEVLRVIHIALLCCQEAPNLRPSMSKVIMMLRGQSEVLEIPDQPPFIDVNNISNN